MNPIVLIVENRVDLLVGAFLCFVFSPCRGLQEEVLCDASLALFDKDPGVLSAVSVEIKPHFVGLVVVDNSFHSAFSFHLFLLLLCKQTIKPGLFNCLLLDCVIIDFFFFVKLHLIILDFYHLS